MLRIQVAAANPVRSPTTPPPRAITVLPRSTPAARKDSHRRTIVGCVFWLSPGGMRAVRLGYPADSSELATRAAYNAPTVSSLTRTPGPRRLREDIIPPI